MMAFTNWSWPQLFGGTTTTTASTSTTVCFACGTHFSSGGTHLCGAQQIGGLGGIGYGGLTSPVYATTSMQIPVRPKLTKLTITGTAVILEDDYGNGLEIDLDVLRRLMKFDEVEAFAALEALRR